MLEKMEFYRPVISISVEPRTRDDQEKMDQVLAKLMAEDPTLQVNQDKDTGQTILSGMGELHLEIIISRMKREYNTSVNVGKPQVVYRETLAKEAAATAVFDKEVAGQRHFGEVRLVVRPLPRGSGPVFRAEAPVDEVPEGFVKAVEQGVRETMEYGQLMGYPVVDVEVVLMGGSWKESVGSDLAFKVAASMASREAFQKGDPYLLEPIMDVEVYVPDAFMGEVIGDLSARGGKIESISAKADSQNIAAIVPLSKMFGYATALRSASQGRGNFTMKFSHFDKV
jgi:elongation factor G